MAEKKAFIAARLRNPAEAAAAKPKKAPSKTDWVGLACAVIAFGLAAATTTLLWLEWDYFTVYLQ